MRIIEGCSEFHIEEPTAVAIGKFDGIHVGHRALLSEILMQRQMGLSACVFTFDPPPAAFFSKTVQPELTTKEEKRRLFAAMGVDILIEFPLNENTAPIPPDLFVKKVLVEQMNTRFIAAGTDLSFGNHGMGNSDLLLQMADESGFEVRIIEKIQMDGAEVSSSLVREAVTNGEMKLAERLLGSPFQVYGEIVHGKRLGRTIGMPTINQIPPDNKLLPPFGVYYSDVEIEGRIYKGITNIGCKPTVNEKKQVGVETFLYNFNQDVYGDMAEVHLFEFKRPEMKFENIDALKAQMKSDIEAGAVYQKR